VAGRIPGASKPLVRSAGPALQVEGERQLLDSSRNNFERAAIDVFLLKKQRWLGRLVGARIGHDSSGLAPGEVPLPAAVQWPSSTVSGQHASGLLLLRVPQLTVVFF
jgi:hypothetical protein